MPRLMPSDCVGQSKGDDGMPRLTSFNLVFRSRAMMARHARIRSTVCGV